MKQIIFLFFFASLLFLSCSKEEENVEIVETVIDLTGEWTAKGFFCEVAQPDQTIGIEHDLSTGEVVATKITGDKCVPAGSVSFTAMFDGKLSIFPFVGTVGTPTNPSNATLDGLIRVDDENSMTAIQFDVEFTRN